MTEQSRLSTDPQIKAWASSAVGMATVAEIEHFGITASLALAASRAIGELIDEDARYSANPVVLLDGTHDWLSQAVGHPVVVQKKADQECVSVAAASVVAKVARDQLMVELAAVHGSYGFAGNKGYASQEHIAALQEIGPCPEHRISWLGRILADGQLF
jgi:ribonuclease HII